MRPDEQTKAGASQGTGGAALRRLLSAVLVVLAVLALAFPVPESQASPCGGNCLGAALAEERRAEPFLALEVAPATDMSPASVEARRTWALLTVENRRRITRGIVAWLVPLVAEDAGTAVRDPVEQIGGWLGTTNVSMSCRVAAGGDFVGMARLLAAYLHQDAVMAVSEAPGAGMSPSRVIEILLPEGLRPAQVADLYVSYIDRIRDDAGERLIKGMSAADGVMMMAVETEDARALEARLEEALREFRLDYGLDGLSLAIREAWIGFIEPGGKDGRENAALAAECDRRLAEAIAAALAEQSERLRARRELRK